ncbi:MAG: PspA/IM30 family protein [Corynebacterium sp.]|uniref:PspA/IM30 family protein n=1 Tax=Corynebacterium sp. TaxID=1720 RepID=UPI0026DBCAB5|nr:PspA/IM30 family protein [Corynebacterium sp.]MDO5030212.1 PspA/IM30 family protein [Corynebacterium sp.]
MANPFAKGWKYMMSSFDKKIEDNADPKIQIAQAAEAERKRHQEIQRQAAAVIGNRNQLEMQLGRLNAERDKIQDNTRQALARADEARAAGDEATAQKMESTAEVFATQLVNVERELENTTQLHQQAVAAAQEAQRQAEQSQARYEGIKDEIRKLEAQADQAKMQETASKTLQGMQGITDDPNVPTLDSVREKIEGRYANALGAQELAESTSTNRMAEIETSTRDAQAGMRLAEIRAQMNKDNGNTALESGDAPTKSVSELEAAKEEAEAQVETDQADKPEDSK